MAKDGRIALRAHIAALVAACSIPLGFPSTLPAAPPDETDHAVATTLAVQIAMQQGREQLLNGKNKAAVETLEAHIARINGNRAYLVLLRDAYRAYIQELRTAKKDAEAQVYAQRLELLDPPAKTDAKAVVPPAKPLVEESTKPERIARAVKDDDPFREENFRQQTAQNLMDEAEKEYVAKHFVAALRAFEQAYKIDASALADFREHWAYCKLAQIFEQLKSPPPGEFPFAEADREIQQAVSLAGTNARLVDFGKELQSRLQDRKNGKAPVSDGAKYTIVVRHLPKTNDGWQLAETANFRVYHTQSRETAEDVAKIAERTRAEMQRKWFGDVGETWKPQCEIFLYPTAQDYSKATKESETSPGHSTTYCEGSRVTARQIHLHCDDPAMLTAVLPHEATHVALAGQFGDKPLPRWADEGIAVLTEPRDKIDRYLTRLPDYGRQQQLFTVRQLMQCDDWPDARRIPAFYAQSVSVIDFLANDKGAQTLTRFLRDGQRIGYEKAMQKYYGYKDFTELEQEWRRFAFNDKGKPAGVGVAEKSR
jgi:tetratricopeptide (TPR) repeat protein